MGGNNYSFDLSGMPCLVSKQWMETAVGGRQNMQKLRSNPRARVLPASVYLLNVSGGYNPSILSVPREGGGSRLLVAMRRWGRPHSLIGEIQGRRVVDARELRDCTGTFQRTGRIFEDLRLFTIGGAIMASATAWKQGGGAPSAIAVLKIVGPNIVEAHVQNAVAHEKNWMPCIDDEKLRFVYSTDPLITLSYKQGRVHPSPPGVEKSVIRGGSQLVPYKDGWLAVTHQVHVPAQYIHRLAVFNDDLTRVTLGEPFVFQHIGGIEFCAGLTFWEDKYLLSFGARDRQALVAEVTPDMIEAFSRPVAQHALGLPAPREAVRQRGIPGMPLPDRSPQQRQRVEGQQRGVIIPRGAEVAFAQLAAMVKPAQPPRPVLPVRVQKR